MKRRKRSKFKVPTINRVNSKDNAPPLNPDHQDVPQSLKELIKLKKLAVTDSADTKTKAKRQHPKNHGSQLTNTNKSALLSLNELTQQVRTEKMQIFKKKKNKKLQKLKEKRKLKKLQKEEKVTEDFEEDQKDVRKEEIKFGEVAHRPPQLSVLPRKVTKTGFENRPGRKDDLLLKSLLKRSNYNQEKRTPLTDKRKNLSVSDQRQIEIERQRAMSAYRNMKEKKSKNKKV